MEETLFTTIVGWTGLEKERPGMGQGAERPGVITGPWHLAVVTASLGVTFKAPPAHRHVTISQPKETRSPRPVLETHCPNPRMFLFLGHVGIEHSASEAIWGQGQDMPFISWSKMSPLPPFLAPLPRVGPLTSGLAGDSHQKVNLEQTVFRTAGNSVCPEGTDCQ